MSELYLREFGERKEDRPSWIFLHGLFGSSANWMGIVRRFPEEHILVPDLRNHGRSFHDDDVSYPALADDVETLLDAHALPNAHFIGHSMGAKTAMWLALTRPQRVARLVSVDMSPVAYPDRFADLFAALESLPLDQIGNREDADEWLRPRLSPASLRGYLLQNLVKQDGAWQWRINLPALKAGMPEIRGFPDTAAASSFPGDSLFLYGTESDYVTSGTVPQIQRYFPLARLQGVPGVGHWVYAESPDLFSEALQRFLQRD